MSAGTGGAAMLGGSAGMLASGGSGWHAGGCGRNGHRRHGGDEPRRALGGTSAGTGPGGGLGGDAARAAEAGMGAAGTGTAGDERRQRPLHGGASGKSRLAQHGATYGNPLAGHGRRRQHRPAHARDSQLFPASSKGRCGSRALGKLFFSDNSNPERIWVLVPGMMPTVLEEMSNSNGMALDSDDHLVITDQEQNRITRLDPTAATPTQVLIAAAGCKPNDVVVRSDGNIYYSAPNQTGTGFYRISPEGAVTGPRTDVTAPNGIVLSPDEKTLYVGDVQNKKIVTFDVAADGSIGATATPFATAMNDTVDGMCVDCAGNLYAGTSNGIEVYSPTGTMIGTVPTANRRIARSAAPTERRSTSPRAPC